VRVAEDPENEQRPFEEMLPSLKRATAVLREAEIPHVLAGGVASWARGGPESDHDLDFLVKPEDAERALEALAAAGMRPEKPPEQWLYKAYDGDVMIDLIFWPSGLPVDDELIARSDELEVFAVRMRVMRPEDILITKLSAMTEHTLGFESCLEIARALREQIDWDQVRAATDGSPFAKAFFTLIEELRIK
jgi:hypothetical protein